MPSSTLDMQAPALSIIVPFFNERPNIAPLLDEIRQTMDAGAQTYEVICIDDGSTDGTGDELRRIAQEWAACRLLCYAENRGQAAALLDGMAAAAGAIFVTLDGDGQNDPADIPALVACLVAADMVAGVRARRNDSLVRRSMSRLANGIRSRMLGDGVTDTGCALKTFRREVASSFLPIRTLYSFMPALAKAAGFRVVEFRVNHRPRVAGVSKYGLAAMLWRPAVDMIGVRWFMQRRVTKAEAL